MESRKVLFWLLGAIAINRLCSLVPAYVYFDPFPFYDIVNQSGENIGITLQSYIYCISQHLIQMVLMFLMASNTTEKLGELFSKFFWLETLSLLDFFLIFEHSFMTVFGYGVEFTDIKLIIYTYLIISWNHHRR